MKSLVMAVLFAAFSGQVFADQSDKGKVGTPDSASPPRSQRPPAEIKAQPAQPPKATSSPKPPVSATPPALPSVPPPVPVQALQAVRPQVRPSQPTPAVAP